MRETFVTVNNLQLHVYVFEECEKPKGVVHIMHGVNEHGLRYQEIATFLNKHDYVVYVHDHISQGKSRLPEEETVYFGKQGVNNLTDGVIAVYNQIKRDYVNLPVYALGHSLGASIVRKTIMDNNISYQKVVLNGSGLSNTKGLGLVTTYGRFLSLFGPKRPSKFF